MHDRTRKWTNRNQRSIRFTRHARLRSHTRGISTRAIAAAVMFGHRKRLRGADAYTLGLREVERCLDFGIDASRWIGVRAICGNDGEVITVYRKHIRTLGSSPGESWEGE